MLGEPSLEKLMRLHLKTQQKYGDTPFAYLPQEDKMKILDMPGTRSAILKSTLDLLFITGLWLQIYISDKSNVNTVQQLEGLLFASVISVLYLGKRSIAQHGGAIVELYNLFASFEQSCLKGKSIFCIQSVIRLFCRNVVISTTF